MITGEIGAMSAAARNGDLDRIERDRMAWEAAVALRAASLELDGNYWNDANCIIQGYEFARAFIAERDKQRGGK